MTDSQRRKKNAEAAITRYHANRDRELARQKAYREANPERERARRIKLDEVCEVDGCEDNVQCRNLCPRHYSRLIRHGDPLAGGSDHVPGKLCLEVGCSEPHHSNGLCGHHAQMAWRDQLPECKVDDCDQQSRVRGWCSRHYQRWRKYGDPLAGPAFRRHRGKGLPKWAYWQRRDEQRAAADKDLLEYVEILRSDPCAYCSGPTEHIDHIVPVARGGQLEIENVTAACARCNMKKSATSLLMFLLLKSEEVMPS